MGSGRVVRVGVLINHWGGHGRAVRGIYSQSDGHGHLADPRTTLPFLTWASVGLGLGREAGGEGQGMGSRAGGVVHGIGASVPQYTLNPNSKNPVTLNPEEM